MKFLILGCNGMAGHMISIYLKENGHDVIGFARKKNDFIKVLIGDAADTGYIKRIIQYGGFDIVVNCIGILTEKCEAHKGNAVYINSYLPHYLAEITGQLKTKIIHMSTDCVFSGTRGGYSEFDLRDGTAFYDRSKALGELEDGKNITIRSSIVGPDINDSGSGLLNWFMMQTEEVYGYSKVLWNGQTSLQYAKTIEIVASENIHGIINLVPDNSISKYDLLCLFNKYLRRNSIIIRKDNVVASDKSLIRTRQDLNYKIPDYEIMIAELAEWMYLHKNIYPHYCMI